jgi:hypothetical protein
MRELFQRLKGGETYGDVMKSLVERYEVLSRSEPNPAKEADKEEIQKHADRRYLDEIVEMQRGSGSDELALRQFLWANYKDQFLTIRRVDH